MAKPLSTRLLDQQDIRGPRQDYRNKDFHGWAMDAEKLEARVAELEDSIGSALIHHARLVEIAAAGRAWRLGKTGGEARLLKALAVKVE